MPIAYFTLPNGKLNPEAAVQQCGLLNAIYHNDLAYIQNVISLTGGGSLLRYQVNPDTLPVDFMIIQQGKDYYWIGTGTTNAKQWIYNGISIVGTPNFGLFSGYYTFSFAYDTWQNIMAEVLGFFPNANINLHISGHSLSGAVAMVMADYIAKNNLAASVELMTFGQPKTFSENYTLPTNIKYFRICTSVDIVPYLPNGEPLLNEHLINHLGHIKILGSDPWTQFGQRVNLTSMNTLVLGDNIENDGLLPSDLVGNEGFITSHYINTYNTRLLNYWDANYSSEPMHTITQQNRTMIKQPFYQNLSNSPSPQSYLNIQAANQVFFGNTNAYITSDNVNDWLSIQTKMSGGTSRSGANIFDYNGGEAMANSLTATIFKFKIDCNDGTYGFSNSVYYSFAVPTTWQVAYKKAVTWANLRCNLLGRVDSSSTPLKQTGQPLGEFLTLSDALNERRSQTYNLTGTTGHGIAMSAGNGAADPMSVCVSSRLQGLNVSDEKTIAFSNHLIIGQADSVVVGGQYVGNAVAFTGVAYNSWDKAAAALLNLLCNDNFGFLGLKPANPNRKAVQTLSLTTAGLINCLVPAHGYTTGVKVKLTHSNQSGLNKAYTVSVVDTNNFTLDGTAGVDLTATRANVQLVADQYGIRVADFYTFQPPPGGFTSPLTVKVSKKNPSRQILNVSFRHRARRST